MVLSPDSVREREGRGGEREREEGERRRECKGDESKVG